MALRRRRGHPLRIAFEAALLIAALWLIGLVWYAHDISKLTKTSTAETANADAVVVLTGSPDRLTLGFELLAAGRAQRLFISGVYRGVDVQQILRALRRSPHEAENAIALGYGADDTVGNAEETAVWMAKGGYTSLILVTSNFHMPRALVEFRAAMPKVTIVPHATAAASFKIDDWWRWPGTIRLIASEWTKYLAARTTLALGLRVPPRELVSPAPMEPLALPDAMPLVPEARPPAAAPEAPKPPPAATAPAPRPSPAAPTTTPAPQPEPQMDGADDDNPDETPEPTPLPGADAPETIPDQRPTATEPRP
ncbi:MAG: YdcF family protein [Gemmatimonas sp.]